MSGLNCISLSLIQSGPGAFFGFRCLISIQRHRCILVQWRMNSPLLRVNTLYICLPNPVIQTLKPFQLYRNSFPNCKKKKKKIEKKTFPIVQKFMASDILFSTLITFSSINDLFIAVDFDPALGFIMGLSVCHILYTEFLLLSNTSW